MGILSRFFKGSARYADKKVNSVKDTAKTVLGVENAKQNLNFTKEMINELKYKEDTETPRYKDYEEWKAKNTDVSESTMHQVYARNCKAALMFGFMVIVGFGLMIHLFIAESSVFHKVLVFLPILSFTVMMFALYLRYSLVSYQIKIKKFISLQEFLPISLSKGFPNISFKLPAEWRK